MNLATELLVLFWLTYSVILVSVNEKCDLVQLLALTQSLWVAVCHFMIFLIFLSVLFQNLRYYGMMVWLLKCVVVWTQDGVTMCYRCDTTWWSYSEAEDEDGSEAQDVRLQARFCCTIPYIIHCLFYGVTVPQDCIFSHCYLVTQLC